MFSETKKGFKAQIVKQFRHFWDALVSVVCPANWRDGRDHNWCWRSPTSYTEYH